ncbi:MAG: hypothetical protein SPG10_00505 [Enterocloster clostridioformis]|nr:hypothetical protein [Enterocloster clostridioformis]
MSITGGLLRGRRIPEWEAWYWYGEALDKRFSDGDLPMVLDIHRPNLCEDFKG